MKKISFFVSVALIAFFIYCLFLPSKTAPQLSNVLLAELQKSHLNCTALVAVDGQVVLSQGFGFANRETRLKNTPATQFLIGSITKIFTATAILKLVDEGKIQEAATVSAYLPPDDPIWAGNAPDWIHQVTIRDLLTHSSGLKEYVDLPNFSSFYDSPHTTEELIQFFASNSLKFKPGTQFEYSGSGYNVLGAIIERVSDMNFGQYLTQTFFDLLRMKSSFAPHHLLLSQVEKDHPSLALGYTLQSDQSLKLAGDLNLTTAFAEASLISTTLDLYMWTQALFSLKIVSEESLNKMTHPYFETDEKDIWMGYGLFIDKTHPNNPIYCHSGRINGYESFWCHQPKHNITVIVLSNEMGGSTYEVAHTLLQKIIQKMQLANL